MNLRRGVFKEFAVAFFCAVFTIILFYNANGVKNNTYIIAFFDALFKSITMVTVISILEEVTKKQYISGASVFLLVTVLYNQNSILKYAVDSLYDGSLNDLTVRFWGSCYINFIIVLVAILWKKRHQKNKEFNLDRHDIFIKHIKISPILVWLIVILYLIIQIYYFTTSRILVAQSSTRTMNTIIAALEYVCFTMISINVKRNRKGFDIVSLFPIGAVGVFLLIATVVLGTKQIFLRAAIVITCTLLFQEKITIKGMKYYLYISPFILQGITNLSEVISGRFSEYNSYWMLRYHVFRYDLSDLAMTFATRFDQCKYQLGVIKEAFLYVLPKFINKNKQQVLPMYNASVRSVGLEGHPMDYNDTIFSIGGQIGGVLGILLFFTFVVFLHEWISKKLIRIKIIGPAIMMSFFGYFSYIESDLFMFLYLTRDLLVYLLVAWCIFRFVIKNNKVVIDEYDFTSLEKREL